MVQTEILWFPTNDTLYTQNPLTAPTPHRKGPRRPQISSVGAPNIDFEGLHASGVKSAMVQGKKAKFQSSHSRYLLTGTPKKTTRWPKNAYRSVLGFIY